VHDRELTYCLALPAGKEWQGGTSWLVRFHRVVRDALAEFGIRASLCQAGEERKLGEVLCFLHHTPGDVILEGAKVVGSAQRKGHGALLQHGGILLGQSDHTPELPGIAELTGRGIAPAALGEVLARLVAREAGWALEPGEWTEGELEFAAALAAERYGSAGWNERR
jgi:lipoate-protein ligase A